MQQQYILVLDSEESSSIGERGGFAEDTDFFVPSVECLDEAKEEKTGENSKESTDEYVEVRERGSSVEKDEELSSVANDSIFREFWKSEIAHSSKVWRETVFKNKKS